VSPQQFSHTPGFYKNISAFCSESLNPCCFDILTFFSTVDPLFKDVEAVHVYSRPWSVKNNKQLLKPRKMWARTIFQARANSRIINRL
jgi:hypothetical protein